MNVSDVTVRRARKMLRILAARRPLMPRMQEPYKRLEIGNKNDFGCLAFFIEARGMGEELAGKRG